MKKRLSLALSLLTGAVCAGGFVPNAIAATVSPIIAQRQETSPQPQITPEAQTSPRPQVSPQPQTSPQAPAASGATLTVEDMPPGFQAVPPQMTANFVEMLRKQLGQFSINPQNLFAFITQPNNSPNSSSTTNSSNSSSTTSSQNSPSTTNSPNSQSTTSSQNSQIVVGYTGIFADKTAQDNFDAALKQMQQPEMQQQLLSQIREQLKNSAGIEIQEYSLIPELNNFAEASTGMSLKILMAGQPMRIDIGSFRRNTTGALAAVMYPEGQTPKISLTEIARKLDTRISQAPPAVNGSPSPNGSTAPNGSRRPATR
jgi:hypothetical protein